MIDLFQQVLENPRSLRARRELAAHWMSQQDPRGELIDIELRVHDLDFTIPPWTLDGRYHQLLEQYEVDWTTPARRFALSVQFELGLAAGAVVTAEKFIEQSGALIRSAPIISLVINDPADARDVVNLEALDQIVDLEFRGRGLDDALALAIARSPHLHEVRVMSLADGTISQRGLGALVNAKNLPNLISLELTGNPCASAVMENENRYFFVGDAGKPFLEKARDQQIVSSDPWRMMWPPVLDEYAWTE